MVVSFLMNRIANLKHLSGFEWLAKQHENNFTLSPDRIVYVGLRDIDEGEKRLINDVYKIKAFSMHHVDKYGIGKVMEMALDYLCSKNPNAPLHLSFDIDSVDPVFAPSTGTLVVGGLTDRESHFICEATAETGLLGSMDMVEVNPSLKPGDPADLTALMATRLIGAALGNTIL